MKLKYWLASKRLLMAQLHDLKRQLQEAWDEQKRLDKAFDFAAVKVAELRDKNDNLRDQLHRVARERDNERKLRLEAEDKLLDYHLDNEDDDVDPMDDPQFIWVHLNHPCREIDVWYVTQPEEAKIAKRQGYIPLTTLRLIYAAEELRDAYLEELDNEEE